MNVCPFNSNLVTSTELGKDFKEQKKQLMISYAKQEIIDAVVDIIAQEGIKKLTMSKVAKQAGIAKGTLYSYFYNKDDLIDSTIQHSLEPLTMAIKEIIESERSPDQKIQAIVDFHMIFFEEHKHYFRVLIYEHQRSQDTKKRFMENRYQQYLGWIGDVIEEGIEEGLFKPLNSNLVAVTFSEALIGVTMQFIVREEGCDMKEAKKTINEVLFKGIRNN